MADDLLVQVCDFRDKALGVLKKAEGAKDWRASIAAIREARGCVELIGKVAGQLKDAPTLNPFVTVLLTYRKGQRITREPFEKD